jgi:hypothetical protein
MRKHLAFFVLVSGAVVACGSSTTGASPDGGGGGGGGGGGTQNLPVTSVAEKEPNNGPGLDGMQDIGAFDAPKVIKITGKLDTGGNDGQSYTGDFDGFVFTVPAAGGKLEAKIEWSDAADVDAVLYDANLNPLDSDATTAKPIVRPAKDIPAGKYALVLFSKDNPATWTLTLTYSKAAVGSGGTCTSPLQSTLAGTGCVIELIEPANGAQLTLPAQFGFKSLGCETPAKLYIYGNPPTPENSYYWQFLRGSLTLQEWFIKGRQVTQDDLAGLKSDNGVYHWQMESFHGAKSEARTFTVAPAVCK